jgi:hypothetical protein
MTNLSGAIQIAMTLAACVLGYFAYRAERTKITAVWRCRGTRDRDAA